MSTDFHYTCPHCHRKQTDFYVREGYPELAYKDWIEWYCPECDHLLGEYDEETKGRVVELAPIPFRCGVWQRLFEDYDPKDPPALHYICPSCLRKQVGIYTYRGYYSSREWGWVQYQCPNCDDFNLSEEILEPLGLMENHTGIETLVLED